MSDIRGLLGSEKVIGHYRLLRASAKTDSERQLYQNRIDREQRLLDQLQGNFPGRQGELGRVTHLRRPYSMRAAAR